MQRDYQERRALALFLVLILVAGLTAALSLLSTASRTQADDTEWKSPSSNNAVGGDGFEVNPTYAYFNDSLSAENQGGPGDSHVFYDFGLTIPSDANIKGIEVRLDWYLDSEDGTNDLSVELSWDGGTNWTLPVTDAIESIQERSIYLGSSSDLWGRLWNPAEFANANFRVRITCNSDNTGNIFYLEYISVRVSYAPVHHLEVTGDSTMTAGHSNVLTIRARDTLGDIAVNYSGPKWLTFSGPHQSPGKWIPTVGGISIGNPVLVPFNNGVSENVAATTLIAYRSEVITVHVSDGIFDSYSSGIYGLNLTVTSAAATSLDLTPNGGSTTAGSPFTVTVTAYDAYGNIATGYTGTVRFTSSDTGATLPPNYTFTTSDSGVRTFTAGVTLITSGNRTITVTDIGNDSLTNTETWIVNAGAIDHYAVTSDKYTQKVKIPFTVRVTAYDAFGNLVPTDSVTVTMSSSLTDMVFDGNGNGEYGEPGDNIAALSGGTFDIQAKAKSTAENVLIYATDSNQRMGTSEPYTIEDFRCFIATAAYGTPMADQIQVLRDFRDHYLIKNLPGRWFVSTYYRCSPPLARFIAQHDSLRTIACVGLTPIIWFANILIKTTLLHKVAILITIIAIIVLATALLRRITRSIIL